MEQSYNLGLDQLTHHISQGRYANCYFIAVLIALVQTPEIIRKLIVVKDKKPVRIRLFDEYRWREVSVKIDSEDIVWNSLSCNRYQGVWNKLLEIAWAEVRGGLDKMERASPYEAFLGLTAAPFEILSAECEDILKFLQEDLEKGFRIVASSRKNSIDGIHASHSYALLEVNKSSSLLFKLKDPWGDNSPVPSGVLELTASELISNFSHFTICKIHPDYQHTFFTLTKPNKNCISLHLCISTPSNYYILLFSKKPHIPVRFTLWTKSDSSFSLLCSKSNINSLPCIWELFYLIPGDYYLYLEFYTSPTAISLATYSKYSTTIQHSNLPLNTLRLCLAQSLPSFSKEYEQDTEAVTDEFIQTYGSYKYRRCKGKNVGLYVYSLKHSTGYHALYINSSPYSFQESLSIKSDGLEEHSDVHHIFLNSGDTYRMEIRSKAPQWKIRLAHKHMFKVLD